jgi:hypothetical protein
VPPNVPNVPTTRRGRASETRHRHSRALHEMIRTFAIAIAALLYALAVGHAHHAAVDDAPISLGVGWH